MKTKKGINNAKSSIIYAITLVLIILFVYTATNKIVTISNFESNLAKFQWIGPLSHPLALGIPLAEFLISFCLVFPRLNKHGLISSLILMIIFTTYITHQIISNPNLPCVCGGIISSMTWKQHLLFNLVVIGLILFALFDSSFRWKKMRVQENLP